MQGAYYFRMSIKLRSCAFALSLLTLCLARQDAEAQSAPVQYWQPSSWFGFGTPASYGLNESDASGWQAARPDGWFLASTRNDLAMGFNRAAAFGNFSSLSTEGVQFGYNFANSPVSIYAGFDTLKYSSGAGSPFAAFDSRSSAVPGAFTANAGIEFRPTSNLSLSFGASFTQQQSGGLVDSDINSPLAPGASPLAFGRMPR